MGILISIVQLILALALLVSLHELGHFVAARAFGIRVEKFFIFFDAWGKKLFSFKKGDTEYGVGWLPLGGYVKISGMIDESMDKEQMKQPAQDWEFRSKPAWQRLIVMIGGVTVNLLLGFLIFALMLFAWGETSIPNQTVNDNFGIQVHEYGKTVGFENGDKILKVNGKEIQYFEDALDFDVLLQGDKVDYTVVRNGAEQLVVLRDTAVTALLESKGKKKLFTYRTRTVVDEYTDKVKSGKVPRGYQAGLKPGDHIVMIDSTSTYFYDEFKELIEQKKGDEVVATIDRSGSRMALTLNVDTNGAVGFYQDPMIDLVGKMDTTRYGFFESFPAGVKKSFSMLNIQKRAFGKMASGDLAVSKSVMGPFQMALIFGPVFDPENFWRITAILSLILAVMNLLPIPALDGGHVVFLLIEMIIGRPLSDKAMYVAQTVGMVILLTLMIYIFGNDIWQIINR